MADEKRGDLLVPGDARRGRGEGEPLARVGDWLWVRADDDRDADFDEVVLVEGQPARRAWLGCVVHVGSNYVLVHGPRSERSTRTQRVHFDEFEELSRREPGAEGIIRKKIDEQRQVIAGLMKKIQAMTSRLAIGERAGGEDTRALATYRGGSMDSYKRALVRAKDKGLPALFEEIEEASKVMRGWMSAEMLPISGDLRRLEGSKKLIEGRIFGVELYAGLVEQVVCVREGASAAAAEPIYLFQRRHYMDEECLVGYELGGMEYDNLRQFEEWLLRPANLARIMPHPRCAVAFRVRRNEKERDFEDFVKLFFGGDADKETFLYLRNGDQVHRLKTKIDFGEQLFPDADLSTVESGKLYAIRSSFKIERLATEGEYLDLLRREAEHEEKMKSIPEEDRWRHDSRISRYPSGDWFLWDHDSVYYDDVVEHVKERMDEHNRLVLVLQGLLDRSAVFQPHPAHKLWTREGFEAAFRLVYDTSRALVAGDRPDFRAYQARLNERLAPGARTVGQDDYWARVEARRENERLENRYGWEKSRYMMSKYLRPEGNPGPGTVARVESLSKRGCSFAWERGSRRVDRWGRLLEEDRKIGSRLLVPREELLCVEAYQAGDYRQFYDDPRTRADYLQWAPLLLRAEEWRAGVVREPRWHKRGEAEE